MKLNLGSNEDRFAGFTNVDHRKNCDSDIIDDAFVLSTIEDNSVSEITAFHIIEHACFDRVIPIMKKWRSLLKKGGILWIAVPNFQNILDKYLGEYQSGKIPWEYFNSRIFGNAKVAHDMYGEGDIAEVVGIKKYELAFHRAIFNKEMLLECFKRAEFSSFKHVTECPYTKLSFKEVCVKGIK